MSIQKVAVFGATGNFGTPITIALAQAGFHVTAISRADSTSTLTLPPHLHNASKITLLKIPYTLPSLTAALKGHDGAVCVVGPGGIALQTLMIDAAVAAGSVRRFIVDDFGWGPDVPRSYPEFAEVHALRMEGWEHAKRRAEESEREGGTFSWTGISTGNPIDWALAKIPLMGFDPNSYTATIYDSGTEHFTGTTLQGIGQAVVGVFQHLDETRNRFVRVLSIKTCQNELLGAFQNVTGGTGTQDNNNNTSSPRKQHWEVQKATIAELLRGAREKHHQGKPGWILPLVVSQLFEEGQARSLVAPSREQSDSELLGVKAESARDVAEKVVIAVAAAAAAAAQNTAVGL